MSAQEKLIMIEYALRYAALGWAVLPVSTDSKGPIGQLTPHGVKDATADPATIREWWTARPDANIGVACGEPSGIVVLDLDARSGGIEFYQAMVEENGGALPEGVLESHTGGGGFHYFFRFNGERKCVIAPGCEVISTGGYIVVPPSVHPTTGNRYEWELSSSPIEDYENSEPTSDARLAGGDGAESATDIFGITSATIAA